MQKRQLISGHDKKAGKPAFLPKVMNAGLLYEISLELRENAVRKSLEKVGDSRVCPVPDADHEIVEKHPGQRQRPVGHPRGDSALVLGDLRRDAAAMTNDSCRKVLYHGPLFLLRQLAFVELPLAEIVSTPLRVFSNEVAEKAIPLDHSVDDTDSQVNGQITENGPRILVDRCERVNGREEFQCHAETEKHSSCSQRPVDLDEERHETQDDQGDRYQKQKGQFEHFKCLKKDHINRDVIFS